MLVTNLRINCLCVYIFISFFQVDSFALDENDIEDSEQGLEASKFLLPAETEGQGIQTVDPQTQARLEALLEAAGEFFFSINSNRICDDWSFFFVCVSLSVNIIICLCV